MSELSTSEQKKEDWMNAKWRPMMGWMYMVVCTFDFVIFPILWSLIQSISHGNVATQWSPVTLQGAGLFHMAMGAVIGVAAFGRTQEKLAGKANDNGVATPSFSAPASTPSFGSQSFGTPAPASTPSFGSAPSFGSVPASTPDINASGQKVVPQSAQPML